MGVRHQGASTASHLTPELSFQPIRPKLARITSPASISALIGNSVG
jgi:hypothetical protein